MDCNLKGKPTKKEIYKERNFFQQDRHCGKVIVDR